MDKKELKIEYVPIETLKINEYNPKKIGEKERIELEESIKSFGVVDPIIVNKAKERMGIIIGGNQRYNIYKKLNYKKVPVIFLNIKDIIKEKELCLRLSKNVGTWDYDLLSKFNEKELSNIGFKNEELDEVYGIDIADDFDEEKELKKVIKEPRGVKVGDIYQLGEHRLLIGDCTDRKNWERLLENERFDFCFTDPPYCIGYGIGTRKQKTKKGFKIQTLRKYSTIGINRKDGKPLDIEKNKLKSIKRYFGAKKNRGYLGVDEKGGIPEYDEWLQHVNEFQNPQGANVMVFENWKNVCDLWSAMEKYWKIRNMIIWHLPNRHQGFSIKYKFFSRYDIASLGGDEIMNEEYEEELDTYLKEKGQKLLDSYEIVLYGQTGNSEWNRKKGSKWGKVTDHITWTPVTEKSSGQNIIFGTKPIQILVPYIKILSPRNGIVVEPFAGSGSTIIASEIMNRKCRAIELSEIYAEVIITRWEKFTGLSAELLTNEKKVLK